jgi:1-acyl-sn-glycerol-3-phosphate acyltransferase
MKIANRVCAKLDLPLWYWLFYQFLHLAVRGLFRVQVVGAENIPTGNCIVVANHLGWVDPFLMMFALTLNTRLYFLGAKQAVDCGWKAWLMRRFDILIPFERGAAWMGRASYVKSMQVIDAGATLGIFPEGRVGSEEGALLPIQRGIGHVLLHANRPVLPIALSGAQELYFRKPITVIIGKPLRMNVDGLARRTAIDSIVAQVESTLRALIPRYAPPNPPVKLMRFLTY